MILDEIVKDKKVRIEQQKKEVSSDKMREEALRYGDENRSSPARTGFFDALSRPGLSIIGEFKKASPSLGTISSKIDLTERIEQYNGSVDAISCLTEEDHFNGSTDYFKKIRSISELPMIRKDFIIDEYQIYEAKLIGADAVLLIAAILTDKEMKKFYELAESLGMDSLVEVHDEEEMKRAAALGAKIIGVNNRNLKDFTIDLRNTEKMINCLKTYTGGEKRPIFVSESGVTKEEDILYLKQYEVDALLIGRAFMEAEEPRKLAIRWKELYDAG